MNEDNLNQILEEPAQPATPEQQPEKQDQQEPQVQAAPKENSSERNMRALREIKDRTERERDDALRRIQELEGRYNKVETAPQPEEDDEIAIGADEIAEGKHLKKVTSKIKQLERQLQQVQQKATSEVQEARLRAEYPDFDKIVNKENLELLRELHPHIANTINTSTDLYSKAASAYTLIKSLGIHTEDTFQQDKQLAQRNAAKPKPLQSISPQQGNSPLSRANAFASGLTDELREQLRKEIEESSRYY